ILPQAAGREPRLGRHGIGQEGGSRPPGLYPAPGNRGRGPGARRGQGVGIGRFGSGQGRGRMSVLVCGGTCCLGYHLLSLLSHGKGNPVSYSGEDPEPITTLKGVTYITGDLLDFKNLLQVLGDTRPTEIYHMVSQGFSLGMPQLKPNAVLQFLILGTQNLLEAVRHTVPKARVILVSSSEIYGAGRGVVDVIHRETDPPIPFTPYATALASCELLAKQYMAAHNLDIVTIRPFSSTGPLQ